MGTESNIVQEIIMIAGKPDRVCAPAESPARAPPEKTLARSTGWRDAGGATDAGGLAAGGEAAAAPPDRWLDTAVTLSS